MVSRTGIFAVGGIGIRYRDVARNDDVVSDGDAVKSQRLGALGEADEILRLHPCRGCGQMESEFHRVSVNLLDPVAAGTATLETNSGEIERQAIAAH